MKHKIRRYVIWYVICVILITISLIDICRGYIDAIDICFLVIGIIAIFVPIIVLIVEKYNYKAQSLKVEEALKEQDHIKAERERVEQERIQQELAQKEFTKQKELQAEQERVRQEQRRQAYLKSEQEYEERKHIAPPQMLHPEYIEQDASQSILINGRYDLEHFSANEYGVIRQTVINSGCKYDTNLGALKLVNAAYPVMYKPRYVLFEMPVQLYGNSTHPNDILAVALAYAYKGAAFRVQAITYFETYLEKTGKLPLETGLPNFMILSEPLFSNKLSELYEKEHLYQKALFYTKNAYDFMCKHYKGELPYYPNRIAALEELIKNPKKKRKGRRDEKFERQITEATTKIINILKSEGVL